MKPLAVSILLAAACAAPLPALAADPPKCQLIKITEWPVRLQRGLPIIEGAINGKKIGVPAGYGRARERHHEGRRGKAPAQHPRYRGIRLRRGR
jgi:hypothetical protein